MRRATIPLLSVALLLLPATGAGPAAARPSDGATALGEAYRAFEAGDYPLALSRARGIDRARVRNPDYVLYVTAQSAYFLGQVERALADFRALAGIAGSRFQALARWRVADCLWRLGRLDEARGAYARLVGGDARGGEAALARFRIGEASFRLGDRKQATAELRRFVLEHPRHPLEERALARLGEIGAGAAALSPEDRVARAIVLSTAKDWHEAIEELALVGPKVAGPAALRRDFWTARTLYSMRRHYRRAGDIYLRIYKRMGDQAAFALFHGARALSRADFDDEAIRWYQRVVAEYPSSRWAPEAQFLSGWLLFNMGRYREAVPYLQEMLRRFPRSSFADAARWYKALSHHLLGEHKEALPLFRELSTRQNREMNGRGRYWTARALSALGRDGEATAAYKELVGRHPFLWYALLARARLADQGIKISPFGESPRPPDKAPPIERGLDKALAADPLIRSVDELVFAGLGVEAGLELRRGESGFLKRHPRPKAMAMLLDRYRRAGNFNRPWMLAIVQGGRRALDAPAEGPARVWWEHAHPLAYRDLVEKWRELGESPPYYLYAIMHKESGFDPHVHSYADAQGLLQMIPPTTVRVARALKVPYSADMLYDPEFNVRAGSWYIGRLLKKFRGQIPIGAGSYNSGPGPVMRWLDQNGDRPIDEFVELVAYSQTRNYMMRVTETYARYLYLYAGEIYEQPLAVDKNYLKDDLTY